MSEFKKTVGYIVQKSQCRPHIEALVIIPDEMSGVQMSGLCPLDVISLVRAPLLVTCHQSLSWKWEMGREVSLELCPQKIKYNSMTVNG